jgi:transcriptional regulator with XRE-family HTH domain
LTRYRIAAEAGVSESTLSRFLAGKIALSTTTLDKLAAVLRLKVVSEGPNRSLLRKYGR